eukprot:CAMPEP_0178995196 /NCGR_PEP_ID=MMETSP0795-20121207/7706_1 /TAXON_ID=88552 /ORGANISM="Amoebophrya sp., Strain Ameob2" /LENGTH=569 /DNA_ID=CAMNT_0020687503 /DNA_START=75 /DNA_END=1786 /DNA_ORIENTATION=+
MRVWHKQRPHLRARAIQLRTTNRARVTERTSLKEVAAATSPGGSNRATGARSSRQMGDVRREAAADMAAQLVVEGRRVATPISRGAPPGPCAAPGTTSHQQQLHRNNSPSLISPSSLGAGTKTVIYTVASFVISMALVHITKWIYVQYRFEHPLWLTITHMLMSYVMAVTMIFVFNWVPDRRPVPFSEQLFFILPFSFLGAASIACGNISLVHLYPSFHQMLQNTSPLWTFVCSLCFFDKRYNSAAYWSLLPVCLGGALTAWGEPSKFAWIGVVVSLGASIFRALRAVLQATLMHGKEPIDSISLLYYATPFNMVIFLVASVALEGDQPWRDIAHVPVEGWLWIVAGACCAALFNLFGFLLVGQLGAVGSMVIGNLKTPTTIVTSYLIFGNNIAPVQVLGFSIATVGAYIYTAHGKEEDPAYQMSVDDEQTHDIEHLRYEVDSEDLENRILDRKMRGGHPGMYENYQHDHGDHVNHNYNLTSNSSDPTGLLEATTTASGTSASSNDGMSSDTGTSADSEEEQPLREGGGEPAGRQWEYGTHGGGAPRGNGRDRRGPGPYQPTGSTWMCV